MQNLPLISVIIPTYNRGSLILGAVNSVLNQTYRNIELLVVDDCSTDNTSQILENLKDSRIKYIRLEKNSGACTARNKGIEYASGEFIAFNDSDDLWLPEKLERQLDFLKENNADIVLCKMECKTPENEFIHNFPNLDKSQQISYTSLLKYNSASTQTFFGKTFCFKNIMFDASMPRLQDWDEALRLSLQYKIFFQNEILVNTFFQKDSISTHPEKGVAAMKKLFQKHSQKILSDKKTAESFLKKQAAFVCKTGKNPTEEFALLLKISPGLSVFLRYLLSLVGIYSFLFRLVLKK